MTYHAVLRCVAVLVVVGAVACRSSHPGPAESYAVYSAYLEYQIRHNAHDYGRGDGVVLIEALTSAFDLSPDELQRIKPHLKDAQDSTLSDFQRLFRNSVPLERRFNLPTSYVIASEQDIQAGRAKGDYGVVVLSQVGFNRSGTQALFHIDHLCPLCGGSGFVLMKKNTAGEWTIQSEYFTLMT